MKFLSIYKQVERNTPPSAEEMATMGKLVEEGFKAGWLMATEGCLPTALGARVRRDGTKISVTDGPFTEAKEVVGGVRDSECEFQGRGDPAREGLPERCRRRRV